MFEKDAEEYVMREDVVTENNKVPFDNGYGYQTVDFEKEVKQAFKDGAEFGYNKANEWHYVKDGDLPKEKKEYWCKVFYYESEETFNAFLWFDPNTKEFKLNNIDEDEWSGFKVKEWCEIPEE